MENRSLCIREETLVIPTRKILDQDPMPRFFDSYPYVNLSNIDDKHEPVSYASLIAENDCLRMTVIPSLGARLYDLFDKVNGEHVFHYSDKLMPSIGIAIRGPWIANGIEFNSLWRPQHTPDNFVPVDSKTVHGEDGSATVYLGNINLVTNICWLVGLTLRPGRQFVEIGVRLFNSDSLYTRYYFWTNSAESVTSASRLFVPGTRMSSGSYPVFEGEDISWYKNNKYASDCYVIDSEEDFFGCYDYDTRMGVVVHANHFRVPGKKRFTWGASDDGLFWAPILSDKGLPYVELQTGRFRTQDIVEFADPHLFEEWKEWWYPIAHIGGLSFANKDAAIHMDSQPEGKAYKVELGIYATRALPRSTVRVRCGDEVFEEKYDLAPGSPLVKNYTAKKKNASVQVIDENGTEVIAWDGREYRTKVDDSVSFLPVGPSTLEEEVGPEETWLRALAEDKRGEPALAETKYRLILQSDPNSTRALCALAVLCCRKGEYKEAVQLLEKAAKTDPSNESVHFYLGLAHLRLGDYFNAEIELWRARASQKLFSPASYHIAALNLLQGKTEPAEEILREATARNAADVRTMSLYAAVLRRCGKHAEGLQAAKKALAVMPFYYPALFERMLCAKETGEHEEAKAEFERVVLVDTQKVLEVAKEYIGAGLYHEAEEALKTKIARGPEDPMTHYYLGFVHAKTGKPDKRDKEYQAGNALEPAFVFPHRTEEIEILKSVQNATGAAVADYYLGNLLMYARRFDEAVRLWETAKKKGLRYPVLYRNLGYAYYTIYRDGKKAMANYKKAIGLDPSNTGSTRNTTACAHGWA